MESSVELLKVFYRNECNVKRLFSHIYDGFQCVLLATEGNAVSCFLSVEMV